jgi:TatD DNase family protein
MIIDTHAHLYSKEFDIDRDAVVQRALDNGVTKMIIPGTKPEDSCKILDLCTKYPANCFPALAVHPTDLADDFRKQLKMLEQAVCNANYCAVGETGLDLYWDKTRFNEQKEAFIFHIELASSLDLPLILHCRDAFEPMMEILTAYKKSNTRGVFHCFIGNAEQAKQIEDLGFLIGIGGVVTFKKSDLKYTLHEIGLNNVVLETDCPYLAPVPYRGKRNEPAYLVNVVDFLSNELQIPTEQVESITSENATKMFDL